MNYQPMSGRGISHHSDSNKMLFVRRIWRHQKG